LNGRNRAGAGEQEDQHQAEGQKFFSHGLWFGKDGCPVFLVGGRVDVHISDADRSIVPTEDICPVGFTVHPPGDDHRGAAHLPAIDIFAEPVGVIPLAGDPHRDGGTVTADVAEEGIAGHILAVTTRRGCQRRLDG
jgi:hypothetical protein